MSTRPTFAIPVVVFMEVEAVDYVDARNVAEILVESRVGGAPIEVQWRPDLLLTGKATDVCEINQSFQKFLAIAPGNVVRAGIEAVYS